MPLLVADALEKTYTGGAAPVAALRGVSLVLEPGDFVALMGPSGCGKSTLLHLCGAMDRPSAGTLAIEGRDIGGLDDDALTRLRRDRIGFVFQFFNLLPTLTIGDNIALPCLLGGMAVKDAETRAAALAERVGIGHRLAHYPQQVSGGEAQRAAIARALVHQPALLVADEPTGNLDSGNGANVLALLVGPEPRPRHHHPAGHACGRRGGRGRAHAADARREARRRRMSLRLFRQFILRRMAHERTRTLTTVAGIALGIGVVIAIQLTNASSVRGFETALDTVSGRASIEILGTGGIDETLLPSLGWLREFGPVSPVIEGDMAIVTGETPARYRPRRSEAVKVLGVDILRDRTLRDYAVGAYAPAAGQVRVQPRARLPPTWEARLPSRARGARSSPPRRSSNCSPARKASSSPRSWRAAAATSSATRSG